MLILTSTELLEDFRNEENTLIMPYSGQPKTLFQYLDTLESSDRFEKVILHSQDPIVIFKDLKKLLIRINAAGGVIENNEGKFLLIFRRSFWDLPKGKLDKDELFENAALRECEEETGLKNLQLKYKICHTYHFFRDKNNTRALKKTKWYFMRITDDQVLIPQLEEDIELAEWIDPLEAILLKPIYKNILLVLNQLISIKSK